MTTALLTGASVLSLIAELFVDGLVLLFTAWNRAFRDAEDSREWLTVAVAFAANLVFLGLACAGIMGVF